MGRRRKRRPNKDDVAKEGAFCLRKYVHTVAPETRSLTGLAAAGQDKCSLKVSINLRCVSAPTLRALRPSPALPTRPGATGTWENRGRQAMECASRRFELVSR